MEVTPLSDVMGAEVTGVDLSVPMDPATKACLRDAFLTHQVLVVRDQHLTPRQQVAFSSQWGDLETPDNAQHTHGDSNQVMILSNEIRPDGSAVGVVDGGDFWHSDSSHHVVPSMITILQSIRHPARGGDTEFCNMYAVFDALGEETKAKLGEMSGIHHVSKTKNKRVTISPSRPGAKDFYELQAGTRDEVIQPLVLVHPETGRQALYCSPRFTIGIKGLAEAEADAILDQLFAYVSDRKRRWHIRHKWRDNDLVMWDNRCVCHRAVGGYGLPDIRCLHRTVVAGDRAYADQEAA